MKIRKNKNKKKLRRNQIIVGIIFILIGLTIIIIKYLYIKNENKNKKNLLKEFYQEQEIIKENKEIEVNISNKYIAVLKIPKLDLEKGLFSIDNPNNNIDKNIQIIKESEMPDVENSNLILAAHNGNSPVSYFNEIHKLEKEDEVIIIYKGKEYKYKVINSYIVDKTGKLEIIRNNSKKTLTLITCSGNNKQIVFICELNE